MRRFLSVVFRLDISLHMVAGIVLAFMMLVTLADVIARAFGSPIVGSVELICFCGAVVIGFALPYSSWKGGHVFVDFLLEKLSKKSRVLLKVFTKSVGLVIFLFIGYNFILYGLDLVKTGEVSAGLRLPYYPITFGLAVSCFLESVTFCCDLLKLFGEGKND